MVYIAFSICCIADEERLSFSCRIGLLERMPILEKSSSGTALTNGDATQNDDSEYGNGPMPQSLTNLMPAKEAS